MTDEHRGETMFSGSPTRVPRRQDFIVETNNSGQFVGSGGQNYYSGVRLSHALWKGIAIGGLAGVLIGGFVL